MGTLDAAFARRSAVDIKSRGPTFPEAAAVVRELHSHLVGTGRQLPARRHVELPETEEVVVVSQPSFVDIEAPAAKISAMRRNYPGRAAVRHDDVRGNRVRFVLDVDDRVLRHAAHAWKKQLGVATHDL